MKIILKCHNTSLVMSEFGEQIENKYRKTILTEKLDIYIIELPKLMKLEEKELKDSLTQLMLFLENPNSKENAKDEKYIKK